MTRNAKLRTIMNRMGMTTFSLAVRCGMQRCTVSSIVSGKHTPSLVSALKIARELGTTVEDLWGDLADDE